MNKIKPLLKMFIAAVVIISVSFIFLSREDAKSEVAEYFSASDKQVNEVLSERKKVSKKESSEILFEKGTYQGLPIKDVDLYKTDQSWGTAIYIPQIHVSPGTDTQDAVNDSAQATQEEIVKVITYLANKFDVNLVMAEGDFYGDVPAEKINNLAKKIEARNKFVDQLENLKTAMKTEGVDDKFRNKFNDEADRFVASLDREIVLAGAPYKLKAEGNNLRIFGAENKDTKEKSTIIVRNYIYQKDRLSQLSGSGGKQVASGQKSLSSTYNLFSMLQWKNVEKVLEKSFNTLKSIADSTGNNRLAELTNKTKETYLKLNDKQKVAAASVGPSRQDNPYKTVNTVNEINGLIDESEKKIQEVVIDQRNIDTAENFARALKENNTDVGILQFGAGHSEGLIKELQKQGLSVVSLTVDEVGNRGSEDKNEDKGEIGQTGSAVKPQANELLFKLLQERNKKS